MALAVCLSHSGCGTSGVRSPGSAAGQHGTQSLFRVRFESPERQASFRLTLREDDAGQFDLTASDPLGRSLWILEVRRPSSDDEGRWTTRWLNHRSRRDCAVEPTLRLPGLGPAQVAISELPGLLRGAVPASLRRTAAGERVNAVHDDEGREIGWERFDALGRPLARVTRTGNDHVLEVPGEATRLRWTRVASEALAGPLVRRARPAGYEEGNCGELDFP